MKVGDLSLSTELRYSTNTTGADLSCTHCSPQIHISHKNYTGSAVSLETRKNLNSGKQVNLTKKILNIQIIY